jgi:hypothetical protein
MPVLPLARSPRPAARSRLFATAQRLSVGVQHQRRLLLLLRVQAALVAIYKQI